MPFTIKRHKKPVSPSSSSSSSSSSSLLITTIAHLDEDTMVEILSRLPIKHMICCELVSKLWYKLISTVCIPRITSSPVHGLVFSSCTHCLYYDSKAWTFVPLSDTHTSIAECFPATSLPFSPTPFNFLDCSNGLLLFFDYRSMKFYVCNPSTQQCFVIPNSPRNKIVDSGALIFDPHFKVVHITGLPGKMSIFCPKLCLWSVHNLNLDSFIAESPWSPRYVFFDGYLYQLYDSGHLLKIDVKEISSQAVELPEIVVKGSIMGCLGVSKGVLHYSWRDKKTFTVRVWMLAHSAGTDQWLLKYTIALQYRDKHPWSGVFAFHPTSDLLFVGNLEEVFCYNPDTESLLSICTLSEDKIIYRCHDFVFLYSVNLTPLVAFGKSMLNKPAGIREPIRVLNF